MSGDESSWWRPFAAVFSRRVVNVVIHTCDKCIFQEQVKVTEQLLKGWFPRNLNFGPHVVTAARAPQAKKFAPGGQMQCTEYPDCLVCCCDRKNKFDIFVDGVLLHLRLDHGHGFLGVVGGGNRVNEAMTCRQASLRQAIADIIKGKKPTIENEVEVEFKASMKVQDRMLEERIAAQQAKTNAEKQAHEIAKAGHAAAVQAKKTKSTSKPKHKPNNEASELMAIRQQRQPRHHARPVETAAFRGFPCFFGACCCKNSEVTTGDASCESDDTPLRVL